MGPLYKMTPRELAAVDRMRIINFDQNQYAIRGGVTPLNDFQQAQVLRNETELARLQGVLKDGKVQRLRLSGVVALNLVGGLGAGAMPNEVVLVRAIYLPKKKSGVVKAYKY
jgi:hypothetical protein